MRCLITILFLIFPFWGYSQYFLRDAQGRIITTESGGVLAIVSADTASAVLVQPPDTAAVFNITMVNPGDVSTPGLANGLRAYWSLEETSGVTAFDSVASYDGTLINTPIQSQTGISNLCYDFDELSEEWINFGTSFYDVGTNDLTVSLWFMMTGPTTAGGLVGNAGTNPDWNVRAQTGSYAKANVNFGTGNIETSTDNILVTDLWYHLVFQLDRDGTTLLYLNNVLQSEQFDISSHSAVELSNSNNFGIGNDHGGASDYFHNGLIDEVSVYNRLISVTEISQLYSVGLGKFWPYGVIGGDTLNQIIEGYDTRGDSVIVISKYEGDGWSTDEEDGDVDFAFNMDDILDYIDTTFLYTKLGDTNRLYSMFTGLNDNWTEVPNRHTVFIDSSDVFPPPQDPSGWDTIYHVDFENRSGPTYYTTAQFVEDWDQGTAYVGNNGWRQSDNRYPSAWVGLLKDSIVVDPLTSSNVIKYSFSDATLGGYTGEEARGGDDWSVVLGSENTEVYFSYNVQFRTGFDMHPAGKLPGVQGGSPIQGLERPTYGEGFRARLTWHWDPPGAATIYYYAQNGPSAMYGSTIRVNDFQPVGENMNYDSEGYFIFDTSSPIWYNMTIRCVVNTFTGDTPNDDGILECFINGYLLERVSGIRFLTLPDKDDGVSKLSMAHFFSTQPVNDEWTYFDDYILFIYNESVEGIPRGNELSPPRRVLNLPNGPKE